METLLEIYSVSLLLYPEEYRETSRTSKMELLAKIANGFQPLTIFANSSILDVQQGSDYTSCINLDFLSRNCQIISTNKVFLGAHLQNSL